MGATAVNTSLLKRRGTSMTAVVALVGAGLVALGVASASHAAALLPGPAPISEPTANNVTADALPTVQIDGVVWSQAIVGDTVYAGGSFANARPAGSKAGVNTVTANNLLAYSLSTGVQIAAFRPSMNGEVRAVAASPDGKRVYVAGAFTADGGSSRFRLAAYDTATGALIKTFKPVLSTEVNAVVATNSTVYVGGLFTTANGVARNRLAAFNASTDPAIDGTLTAWNPNADFNVNALVITPDGSRVIVGGAFQHVGSQPEYGLAAVDATAGAVQPWAANQIVRDAGTKAAIESLRTDGTAVFGTGYVFGSGGNFEGTFSADPNSGTINWVEDCHGDTYDSYSTGSVVYSVSHTHYCGNVGGQPETNPRSYSHALSWTANAVGTVAHNHVGSYTDWFGKPAPSQYNWYPDFLVGTYTGQGQAAWDVTGNGQYVTMGGEFQTVNGKLQQGIVRFGVRSATGNPGVQGPRVSVVPTLSATSSSSVHLSWPTSWDRDDENLTYQVIRNDNDAAPVYTTPATSQFWNLPTIQFTDTGLTSGSHYNYKINVVDPYGNTVQGTDVGVTTLGPPGNQPPVAVFAQSCTNMSCSVNGSTSSDPDGSVVAYAWNFGDGASATGATPATHAYAVLGTYSVTLTVTDNLGATNLVTHSVTVPTPDQPPVAAFTQSCVTLSCSFNGSTSSDPDGSVVGYTWAFGDGASATGVAPASHTYPAAGTYQVTLTVTDDRGGTNSAVHPVPVSASPVVGADTFARNVASGWGSADTGGAWTVAGGSSSSFSVAPGAGQVQMLVVGTSPTAYLSTVSVGDTDSLVDFTFDKAFTGTGYGYAYLAARHTVNSQYRLRAKVLAAGVVQLTLIKINAGVEATIVTKTVTGLTFTPGQLLRMRLQVSGTTSVTLSGKIWSVGSPEPTTWLDTAVDATSPVGAAGAPGLASYLSGGATAPVLATFQNFTVSTITGP